MKITSLNCLKCSAPIEIAEETRLVHCSFCRTQLSVHQDTNGSVYGEIVLSNPQVTVDDKPDESFADGLLEMVEPVECSVRLPIQPIVELSPRDRLERLDTRRENENRRIPSKRMSILAGGFLALAGLCWIISSPLEYFGELWLLEKSAGRMYIGMLMLIAGLLGGSKGVIARFDFEQRRSDFLNRRENLLREIGETDEN